MYPVSNTLLIPTSCMEAVQTVLQGNLFLTARSTLQQLSVYIVCITEWEFSPCCTVNNSPLLLSCGLQCDDVTGSSGLPSNVNLTAAPAALIQSRRSAASGRSLRAEDRRHFGGLPWPCVCVCVCVCEGERESSGGNLRAAVGFYSPVGRADTRLWMRAVRVVCVPCFLFSHVVQKDERRAAGAFFVCVYRGHFPTVCVRGLQSRDTCISGLCCCHAPNPLWIYR